VKLIINIDDQFQLTKLINLTIRECLTFIAERCGFRKWIFRRWPRNIL